jgi:hypothetical protein
MGKRSASGGGTYSPGYVDELRGIIEALEGFEEQLQQFTQDQDKEPDMKFLRAIATFLTKERTSPFSLDVPSDFAYGQWGI